MTPRFNANGYRVGANGGINRWANKFPATCYKCGKQLPRGQGRIVPWRSEAKKNDPLRVQCYDGCTTEVTQ